VYTYFVCSAPWSKERAYLCRFPGFVRSSLWEWYQVQMIGTLVKWRWLHKSSRGLNWIQIHKNSAHSSQRT
jgi:hypothetical protein